MQTRVGQKGTLTRIWAERGSRPRKPQDTRYKWAYIFGAVCPARAKTAALVMSRANAHAMNLHLKEISATVASNAHAVLVLDGAGWHKPPALAIPQNISLLILPPYSPELNPVENVWAYLRGKKLGRSETGHWESDLIICKHARPVLVLHERKTRITFMARLSGKGAAETVSAIMAVFKRLSVNPGDKLVHGSGQIF